MVRILMLLATVFKFSFIFGAVMNGSAVTSLLIADRVRCVIFLRRPDLGLLSKLLVSYCFLIIFDTAEYVQPTSEAISLDVLLVW